MSVRRFSARLVLTVLLLGIIILARHELILLPDGKLHVHFLDVDQGDSVFLVSPSGKQVLIDGGPDLSPLEHLGKFMPFFDRTIDMLVLTHAHSDHLAALPEVLRRYGVEFVILTDAKELSGRYLAFLDELAAHNVSLITPIPGRTISLGDGVTMNVVWPSPREQNDPNNMSVVLRVLFGEMSVLLTGDVEEKAEQSILSSGADIRSTVLKVPHHGSRTSSSMGFLLAVHPQLAVVSAGANNSFGHPHPETVNRYEILNIPLLSTQKEGTVSLSFSPSKMEQTR